MDTRAPERNLHGFDDFVFEILDDHRERSSFGANTRREYSVRMRTSAGDLPTTLHLPVDHETLENRLHRVENAILQTGGGQAVGEHQRQLQDFGTLLFNAAFTDGGAGLYYQCLDLASRADKGLRLKRRIEPSELIRLPWETMYDTRTASYIGLSTSTPIVRDVGLPRAVHPLAVHGPLRILGMVASPASLDALDVDRERATLQAALAEPIARGMVELRWVNGQTWRDLHRELMHSQFHVFHFIGHGGFDPRADEGLVALADERGEHRLIPASELGMLLADAKVLRLVVLNTCHGAQGGTKDSFSSTASFLVRRGIPAVLAMQYKVTDDAAIELSRAFYEGVAGGLPVDAAVAHGRKAVRMARCGSLEWATPVLYLRALDGVLFSNMTLVTSRSPSTTVPDVAPSEQGTRDDWPLMRRHIHALARKYDMEIRTMPRGPERDEEADIVAEELLSIGAAGIALLPDLRISQSPGERLAAVVILRSSPRPEYISWLSRRFFNEQNYIGRHAAIALLEAVRALHESHGPALQKAIDDGKASLERRYVTTSRITAKHRYQILLEAELELEQLQK